MKTYIIFTLFILSATFIRPQDITNTIGSAGFFYVKDGSTTLLTLQQSNGYLGLGVVPNQQFEISGNFRLPLTTSSGVGVIYKGGNPFIHDFKAAGSQGHNTFVGLNSGNFTMAGPGSTDASQNTALGYLTLNSLTSGRFNTAVGSQSLANNTDGNFNAAVGFEALNACIGVSNTAVGSNSLISLSAGNSNTAIGTFAGSSLISGSNCIIIGFQSQASSSSATNEITLGNSSVTSLRCAVTSITSLSDRRDKKNIRDLNLGLDFISKLKPRQFNWDKREWYPENISDGTKMEKKTTAGFIAQELDSVQMQAGAEWLGLVYKNNPEKLEATYGNLLPVIVKAIQELKEKNDKLAEENQELKSKVESLSGIEADVAEIKKLKNKLKEELNLIKTSGFYKTSAEKIASNEGSK